MSNERSPFTDELVNSAIGSRVQQLISAAEQAAASVSREVEARALRSAAEIVADAEAEAGRMRHEAARRVEEYLALSRRRIDAFASQRIERLTELTDALIEAAGAIQDRLQTANAVQAQIHQLVESLGSMAQTVALEAARPDPQLPPIPASTTLQAVPPSTGEPPSGEPAQRNGTTHADDADVRTLAAAVTAVTDRARPAAGVPSPGGTEPQQ